MTKYMLKVIAMRYLSTGLTDEDMIMLSCDNRIHVHLKNNNESLYESGSNGSAIRP